MPDGGGSPSTTRQKPSCTDPMVRQSYGYSAGTNFTRACLVKEYGPGYGEKKNHTTRKESFEPFFTTNQLGKGTGLGLRQRLRIVRAKRGFNHKWKLIGMRHVFRCTCPSGWFCRSGPCPPSASSAGWTDTILDRRRTSGGTANRFAITPARCGYSVNRPLTPGGSGFMPDYQCAIRLLLTDVRFARDERGPSSKRLWLLQTPNLR